MGRLPANYSNYCVPIFIISLNIYKVRASMGNEGKVLIISELIWPDTVGSFGLERVCGRRWIRGCIVSDSEITFG